MEKLSILVVEDDALARKVMSGHDAEAVVERAYALGCDDFYSKGNEASNVGAVIARYLKEGRR